MRAYWPLPPPAACPPPPATGAPCCHGAARCKFPPPSPGPSPQLQRRELLDRCWGQGPPDLFPFSVYHPGPSSRRPCHGWLGPGRPLHPLPKSLLPTPCACRCLVFWEVPPRAISSILSASGDPCRRQCLAVPICSSSGAPTLPAALSTFWPSTARPVVFRPQCTVVASFSLISLSGAYFSSPVASGVTSATPPPPHYELET